MTNEELKEKEIHLVETSESAEATDESPFSNKSILSSPADHGGLPSFGDRFLVLETIGHGGMGVVYKAKDSATGNLVALKVLKKELIADKTALKRFEQEVASLSGLDHESLVALYGQGQTLDGAPYLVMEYIEGISLAEMLKSNPQIEPRRALDLIVQIADGLAHAHQRGIVHRDLKPSNIMIHRNPDTEIETIRILDFGIARLLESTTGNTTNLTKTGDVFGTPSYMSPEQCEGKLVDSRSDIYSLGCVMFELFTGKQLFEGTNPIQVAVKHLNEKPPGFSTNKKAKLKQPLKSLESITLFCLNKNTDERYQSMEELLVDLNRVKAGKKVVKHTEQNRRKVLDIFVGSVFVGYLELFILLGNLHLSDATGPIQLTAQMSAWMFLICTCFGGPYMLFVTILDRANFRSSNKTMFKFWNLIESGSLTICIWTTALLYALSLGCDLGTGLLGWIASALGVVTLIALILFIEIRFSRFVLQNIRNKFLNTRFSKKTARLQIGIMCLVYSLITVAACAFAPSVTAWLPDIACDGLSTISPPIAVRLADTAIMMNPQFAKAIQDKATIDLIHQKSSTDVLSSINSAIKSYPDNAELLSVRALIQGALNKNQQAIDDYTAAIKIEPLEARHIARAMLYIKQKKYKEAVADYSEAITLNPGATSSYTSRGLLYAVLKDYKRSIADLTVSLTSSTSYDRGIQYLRRGMVYELSGDKTKAEKDFRMALLDTSYTDYTQLFLYRHLGMNAEYQTTLSKYIRPMTTEDLKKGFNSMVFGKTVEIPYEW